MRNPKVYELRTMHYVIQNRHTGMYKNNGYEWVTNFQHADIFVSLDDAREFVTDNEDVIVRVHSHYTLEG